MISKNQISYINTLHLKKNREKERLFFMEGAKVVNELLSSSYTTHSIYALEEWMQEHSGILKKRKIPANIVTERELYKISALTTPQQVFALVSMPDYLLELNELKGKLTLILDELKDPGNLGTIIRIADWFGIENIICSHNSVDLYNPKVVQATMGSLFRVKVFYDDIADLLKENQAVLKLPVYAATMKGADIYNVTLDKECFIILGSESAGIAKELMNYVIQEITIPSFAINSQSVESLNVAVAAGIVCSELRRRG